MTTTTSARHEPDVARAADFILEQVGDVARPRAGLPITGDLSHLPGRTGLLAGLATLYGIRTHGIEFDKASVRRHGPVFRGQFGPLEHVFVSDPKLVTEITRNADGVWSAALAWRLLFEGISDGPEPLDTPVMLDFENHKDARRLLQPAFGRSSLEHYVDMTTEQMVPTVDAWLADGRVTFKPACRAAFAHLATRIFIGVDDPRQSIVLDGAMADFWGGLQALFKNPRVSPTWRRARAGYCTIIDALTNRIEESRRGEGVDLFSQLCRSDEIASWIDDAALVRIFFGLMSAAFDTTSMGVTSMIYLLASRPEWQERLRAEARELAPDGVTFENIKKLGQHDWVWKETLRKYPVARSLPRRALKDVILGGYRIPAGALVLANLSAPMHDAERWTAPERFDPERFSPERGEARTDKGTYMPFGAGAHACIGAMLSGLEATTFLTVLLARCRFRLARPYEAKHQYLPLGVVSGDVELILEPVESFS